MMALAAVLLGFLIGLLSGATGIGGGTLLAPFMMFVLKVDAFVAVGTDLVVSVVTKAVGSAIHKRANNIEAESMRPLAIAGVAGALVGIVVLAVLKAHVDVHVAQSSLRRIIGGVLFLCAVAIGFGSKFRSRRDGLDNSASLGIAGFVVAFITSITSVGVGSLIVPALYFIKGRAKMQAVVGTTLMYGAVVTAIGALGHVLLKDVNYALAALLLTGAIPGVALGSTLATRTPAMLRPVVVVLLIVSGLRLVA